MICLHMLTVRRIQVTTPTSVQIMQKKMVLDSLECFSEEEKIQMYNGIYNHTDKHEIGFWFDEIIKDADAVQHSLRNPMEDFFYSKERIQQVIRELV